MHAARRLLLVAILISASAQLTLSQAHPENEAATKTPIKYLVVIFDENNSFDHYFGTYPVAANPPGEPAFHARPGTPTVNGLTTTLLTANPNGVQPFRLDRSQAITCGNDNHYKDEQRAYHGGLMDNFKVTSGDATDPTCVLNPKSHLNMGYYDGNTVTALWNYAQHFAMSDNNFASTFGTTVMGHLNLLSGQTHGAVPANRPTLPEKSSTAA